jgi:hypothetical protein
MNRRSLVKLAASQAISACLLGGMTDNAIHTYTAPLPASTVACDVVETADGVWIAHSDWDKGRPAFFQAHRDCLNRDIAGFVKA